MELDVTTTLRPPLAAIVLVSLLALPPLQARAGDEAPQADAPPPQDPRELNAFLNYGLSLPAQDPHHHPRIEVIKLPSQGLDEAIWGSTGRDDRGHIWFGVSRPKVGSAMLVEYDPKTRTCQDRGDVISQLRRLAKLRPGETQVKIHSRIIQAGDGELYFTSMDEEGENPSSLSLPRFGSHLWRHRPGTEGWEHLASAPQALISLTGAGRYVYALGYYGHVLHRYDTRTRDWRHVEVGSLGEHVSRNILFDRLGYVHVPRIKPRPDAPGGVGVELVRYDASLTERGSLPLDDYFPAKNARESHGIISYSYLLDDSLLFATHTGCFYRLYPSQGTHRIEKLGRLLENPANPKPLYPSSLFAYSGQTHFVTAAELDTRVNDSRFAWFVIDLPARSARRWSLRPPEPSPGAPRMSFATALIYGSQTRDNDGDVYIVGQTHWKDGQALALRIRPAP